MRNVKGILVLFVSFFLAFACSRSPGYKRDAGTSNRVQGERERKERGKAETQARKLGHAGAHQ